MHVSLLVWEDGLWQDARQIQYIQKWPHDYIFQKQTNIPTYLCVSNNVTKTAITSYSLSDVLIYSSINPKYNIQKRNFITNQICFSKKKLNLLLNPISNVEKNWIDYFCQILIENPEYWLSEYQLYANFIIENSVEKVEIKEIKVFRRLDLLKIVDVKKGLKKYSLLAFENSHDGGFLRILRARFFYFCGINLG